jgi:hypothetical protein
VISCAVVSDLHRVGLPRQWIDAKCVARRVRGRLNQLVGERRGDGVIGPIVTSLEPGSVTTK